MKTGKSKLPTGQISFYVPRVVRAGLNAEGSPRFEQHSVHGESQHCKHRGSNARSQPEGRALQVRLANVSSEYDSVEFGPDRLQQLRVEEVLTQAECAPVTSAHAAQPGVGIHSHGGKFGVDVSVGC